MHQIGIKVPHWQIRDRKQGVIVEWDLGLIGDLTPYPYRFHLEQHRLTPILFHKLHAYRHASVRFSTQFISATQDGSSVTALTSAGPIKTPWLVACDGGRSLVRKNLGIDFEGFTWPERFIVISTTEDFAKAGFTSNAYVADPKEWAAVFHMPHDRPPGLWRMAFPVHPDEDEQAVLADEAVEARMQRFAARADRYEVPYRGIYRVHQRVAKEWRAGRVVLAGDAAHLNNPLSIRPERRAARRDPALPSISARSPAARRDETLIDRYVRQRAHGERRVRADAIDRQQAPARRGRSGGAREEIRGDAADRRDREAARDFDQVFADLERPPSGGNHLEHRRAAVDHQRLAGHEGCVLAGEEAHRADQILGVSSRWMARVSRVRSPCLT
jgi:3-(3-hydroxy-phenyl)propionate hydroxylase